MRAMYARKAIQQSLRIFSWLDRRKKEVTWSELAITLLTMMTRKHRAVRNAGHHP
jgi:hypothetical protein